MKQPRNWLELVRLVVPETVSDEDCNELLWSATCYPFGKRHQVLRGLRSAWENGGQTVDGAIAFCEAELDAAMKSIREEEQHATDNT